MNKHDKYIINKIICKAKSCDEIVNKLNGKYDEDDLLDELLNKYNKRTIVASVPLFSKKENLDKIADYFISNNATTYLARLLYINSFISCISKDKLEKLVDMCFDYYYNDSSVIIYLYNKNLIDEEYIINKLAKSKERRISFVKMLVHYNYVNSNIVNESYIQNVALESLDAKLIYDYASKSNSFDVKKLEEKLISTNNSHYIYLFAKDIKGADIAKLTDKIFELGDAYYMLHAVADIDASLINRFKTVEEFLYAISSLDDMSESFKVSLINKIVSGLNQNKRYEDDKKLNESKIKLAQK